MYLRDSIHNEAWLQAGDVKGMESVAQYIIRNSFSLAKLSYIEKTWYGYLNRMRGDRQRAELLQEELEKTKAENNEGIVISNFRTKEGDFYRCAGIIIVCCGILLPNFSENCPFLTVKVLAILAQCLFVGYSVKIIAKALSKR